MKNEHFQGLGIVVIGRNEGERLRVCLASLPRDVPTVYVDSGSTDGSPDVARGFGAQVVELTTDKPFSAARGRNEGFERLLQNHPDTEFVQFIDGDCELLDGWLERGLSRLREDQELAVVAGQRMERYPDKSWYNTLCAEEWNTPIGEARAVGGDALYRTRAFRAVDGFDPMMMAGEEPELCLRLLGQGWRIERLDQEMTLHDAAILTFRAWWKRAVRSGYAYMLGALKHGREGYNVRPVLRALFWGAGLPTLAGLSLLVGQALFFVLILVGFALQWMRIRRREYWRPQSGRYAVFAMLGNMAEVLGIMEAIASTASGQRRIIEYKSAA